MWFEMDERKPVPFDKYQMSISGKQHAFLKRGMFQKRSWGWEEMQRLPMQILMSQEPVDHSWNIFEKKTEPKAKDGVGNAIFVFEYEKLKNIF